MKLILATDGSIEAEIAATVLQGLPLPKDCSVDATIVVQPVATLVPSAGPPPIGGSDLQQRIARRTVGRVANGLSSSGLQARPIVLEGDTAEELMRHAEAENAALIAVGCGFDAGLTATLMGSVGRKLALSSKTSVLVGRHYTDQGCESSAARIRAKDVLDIIVAVDGSAGGDRAIETLEPLKSAFGTIYVVHVSPSKDGEQTGRSIVCERLARLEGVGNRVEGLNLVGRPSESLSEFAAKVGCDLILLGANRHGIRGQAWPGSCAFEMAMRAPCSVLILRERLQLRELH